MRLPLMILTVVGVVGGGASIASAQPRDAGPARPRARPERGQRMTGKSRMRLGMTLPIGGGALGDGKPVPWTALREIAKRGEEVGFDTIMAPDHLLFRRSPPGDVMMVDMPEGKSRGIWEVWSVLSAVAEATLLKVLARNPDHSGALHNLGYLYDRMGRLNEAAALYAREARNPAAAPLAGFTEYLMYFRRGRFSEADAAVRKSIAAEPSANSQSGLALLLLTWKGDAEGAARRLGHPVDPGAVVADPPDRFASRSGSGQQGNARRS